MCVVWCGVGVRFRYLPDFYLKKYVLESFPQESDYPEVIDFVVEQVLCARPLARVRAAVRCCGGLM